ncbi:hypothetical protein K8T06_17320, partial [bacterium]|nr:hypothetical protein [bacterium]
MNPGVVETQSVWIYSDSDSTGETIILTETGVNTAIFDGSVQAVSGSPGSGQLSLSHGDNITVEYDDVDCGGSPVTV